MQTVELKNFYLINTYFPNSNNVLSRLPYKLEFNKELLNYLKKLDKIKPIILTGDLNVAHQAIDLARPKENEGSPGYTKEERDWMTKFLKNNFIDTFRFLNPEKVKYSWWSYRSKARARNVGWRLDYFCISQRLIKKINKSDILDQVTGSDHAPVILEIKD